MTYDDRGSDPTEGVVRVAAFSERVSDLQDLSEMATAIRFVANDVEKGLLGDSVPLMDNTSNDSAVNDPMTERKASDTNLIDELRVLTSLTRDNLQIISDVLNSLGRELGNLGGANEAGYRPAGIPTPPFNEVVRGEILPRGETR